MMKRAALTLLSLLAFASPAQALKLIVWDGELQTKLGAGESSGSKFSVQLVKDYSGPVKVIFSQSADEKSKGQFNGLLNSYDGILKNGQLTLLVPDAEGDRPLAKSTLQVPINGAAAAPSSSPPQNNLTLNRFLQQFKLSVSVQTTGQINNLLYLQSYFPELKPFETNVN